ncbi:SPFH domain-containing protein [Paenibacillus aquistagni]|uniref:Membrane protease subunit, stomatin/prohibitin family, contains C-terminal Zn-ribbon domain n=1 Tax=Paenibacillus aquistagni TaxID=1852522 RepID=A0A1X7JZ42_9BACL|nr:SPFH domain-containing protein [Paenibacillus aquistagni]SMG33792.1 Membrane protease subunit, stomatin/prohibitin family, contains C-terminal Zn-ribbon domain [Paenibacillus aquistagni]
MAIIEVIKYDGSPDVFAWRYPNQELATWTQLIVNESQEAILFKGGQALDRFGAGRHTLSTQNIPLLQSVINIPFGNKSPFSAEVWYINKVSSLNIKWGTPSPITLQDPKYNIMIPVRSYGQFGIQIEDTRKFLIKLNGTLPVFDKNTLTTYFRGVLMMNIHELITTYITQKKVSILEINAYIGEISKHITERLAPIFAEYGIQLLNFYVESVNTPNEDAATKRLREALSKRAEMDILGYNYQQERSFDTLDSAAKNRGGGGSDMMNAGMGLGMGTSLGVGFGQSMSNMFQHAFPNTNTRGVSNGHNYSHTSSESYTNCPKCGSMNNVNVPFCAGCGLQLKQAPVAGATPGPMSTCSKCRNAIPAGAKFCPHCGDEYIPCPTCGADNPKDALQCVSCSAQLASEASVCRTCQASLAPGAKFCMNCGTSTQLTCPKCSTTVQPGQKFCFECGQSLTT